MVAGGCGPEADKIELTLGPIGSAPSGNGDSTLLLRCIGPTYAYKRSTARRRLSQSTAGVFGLGAADI